MHYRSENNTRIWRIRQKTSSFIHTAIWINSFLLDYLAFQFQFHFFLWAKPSDIGPIICPTYEQQWKTLTLHERVKGARSWQVGCDSDIFFVGALRLDADWAVCVCTVAAHLARGVSDIGQTPIAVIPTKRYADVNHKGNVAVQRVGRTMWDKNMCSFLENRTN